jgi:hypothetical protein
MLGARIKKGTERQRSKRCEAKISPSVKYTDNWFHMLDERTQRLLAQYRENVMEDDYRVKVAILDSGIDRRNSLLLKPQIGTRDPIRAVEDFLDPGGDGFDSYGHGTHCAGLLRKVAPEADLYIARVANGDSGVDPIAVAKVWLSGYILRLREPSLHSAGYQKSL